MISMKGAREPHRVQRIAQDNSHRMYSPTPTNFGDRTDRTRRRERFDKRAISPVVASSRTLAQQCSNSTYLVGNRKSSLPIARSLSRQARRDIANRKPLNAIISNNQRCEASLEESVMQSHSDNLEKEYQQEINRLTQAIVEETAKAIAVVGAECRLDEAMQISTRILGELDTLSMQAQNIRKVNEELTEEIARLNEELEILNKEEVIEQKEIVIEKTEEELNSSASTLNDEELRECEEKNNALNDEISQLRATIAQLEEEIASREKEIEIETNLESEIEELEEESASLQTSNIKLREEIVEAEAILEKLNAKIETASKTSTTDHQVAMLLNASADLGQMISVLLKDNQRLNSLLISNMLL
eukprot:TRINITY_DN6158_c0_g2_i1.p1 TRINITY_DN6158_c0_g2~~TRINITY_DN6158_c0_g2_i1.p1  ORF type:complete len:361 (-),score=93.24 TRINITY_DN6158_c0_g2_i1:91-1173(-)